MEFGLHPHFAAETFPVSVRHGCHILLNNESQFPWFIIVPEVDAAFEDLHQLDEKRYTEVMTVVREVSIFIADHFQPEKLNTGCIGNSIRQLHIHVVGRSEGDPAWPGTVWAHGEKVKLPEEEAQRIVAAATKALGPKGIASSRNGVHLDRQA